MTEARLPQPQASAWVGGPFVWLPVLERNRLAEGGARGPPDSRGPWPHVLLPLARPASLAHPATSGGLSPCGVPDVLSCHCHRATQGLCTEGWTVDNMSER